MSWVTIIWAMIVSACLTLAAMYLLVWCKKRTAWASLLFALTAVATAAVAGCELWLMRAETAREFGVALRWAHVPYWVLVISLVGFVRIYLRAGRPWLAWAVCGVRTLSLILNFVFTPNLNYREITALRHVRFLGESVSVAEGISNPWMLVGQASFLLLAVFVVGAMLTVWRRGNRWQALVVGGSIVFFVLAATGQIVLVLWQIVHTPLTPSLFFLGIIAAMAYEMSRETLRAAQLSDDLREHQQRLDLAADSAGVGLWSWDFKTSLIWATERARLLYGFSLDEPIPFERFLSKLHPDDLDWVVQASQKCLQEGVDFRHEYRIVLPDGSFRWFKVLAKVFLEPSGKPERMTGVSLDITERKRMEEDLRDSHEALRSLAGRLLWAQEEERRRLARELHDDLAQRLAVISIDIGKLERLSATLPDRVMVWLKGIGERVVALSTDVHDISRQLHPSIIEDLGLSQAIQSECVQFTRREGIRVHYTSTDVPAAIPIDTAVCLFRVVQEGMRNIAQHAKVKEAEVRLSGAGDRVTLVILDAGVGFDGTRPVGRPALGITSMKERARLIHGEFLIESATGKGTTIKVVAPLSGRQE